jgi:hypothetical protein
MTQVPRPRVEIADPETMSLLGLMLASVLGRSLGDKVPRLRGDVAIDGGGMQVTLHFDDDGVIISRRPAARPIARVRGTLTALLDAALGRGRVRAWLAGRLHVGGSPLALLRLLALLRA